MQQDFPKAFFTELAPLWIGWTAGAVDSLGTLAGRARASGLLSIRAIGTRIAASDAAARGQLQRHAGLMDAVRATDDTLRVGADPVGRRIQEIETVAHHRRAAADGLRQLETLRAAAPETGVHPMDRHDLAFAEAYARLGQPGRAADALGRFEREASREARLFLWGPWQRARGEVALASGRPAEALRAFRQASAADSGGLEMPNLLLQEQVARAFEAAGQRDSAVATLRLLLRPNDPQGAPVAGRIWPHALRRLGALEEALGRPAEARQAYEQFVALWRNADPELQPQVAEIRARLAALGGR